MVSSPKFGNGQADIQMAVLKANLKALKARKLKVYQVTNSGFTVDFDDEIFISQKNRSAITKFNVSLIGLDGTEKFHATEVQKPETFFNLIDAMPMRQAEIKRKNNE